ncbi:MAG: hypothetical protein EOL97_14550 [Spirochaetia bacterium]|nr:hypothetical protein [Spirochaetia bacterium]
MNKEELLKKEVLMINAIIVLLILDAITTIIALGLGAMEQNPILLYFVQFGLSIQSVVIISHILAIMVLYGVKLYYRKKTKINLSDLTFTFLVMCLYITVVLSNAIIVVTHI